MESKFLLLCGDRQRPTDYDLASAAVEFGRPSKVVETVHGSWKRSQEWLLINRFCNKLTVQVHSLKQQRTDWCR